jgi:hypothetical protein
MRKCGLSDVYSPSRLKWLEPIFEIYPKTGDSRFYSQAMETDGSDNSDE